jgi:hypothetical protein
VPDQPYSRGQFLTEDSGHDGVTFTKFASWVEEGRFADIEKLLALASPTHWLRESLIRSWGDFYLIHVQAIDQPAYADALKKLSAAVETLTAIQSYSSTTALLRLPKPKAIMLFAGKAAGRGRRARWAFERLVLALSDLHRDILLQRQQAQLEEGYYNFIELNIRVLRDLRSKLPSVRLQFPEGKRQILRSLRQIAKRSETIDQ